MTMKNLTAPQHRVWTAALALALASCSDDKVQKVPCVDPGGLVGVENVSELELTEAIPGGADAVVLEMSNQNIPEDGGWRVAAVEVLLVIPASEFDAYPKDLPLTISVWDNSEPANNPSVDRTQNLDLAALEWSDAEVKVAKNGQPVPVKQAWWKFDFAESFPVPGMASRIYTVGVRWPQGDKPLVGMSHFDRNCGRNWTDAGDGKGFKKNGLDDSDFCSWPMLRVSTQILTQRLTCEDTAQDAGN